MRYRGPNLVHDPFEGDGRNVVAFVDDDLPVTAYDVIDGVLVHETLDHGHVQGAVWLPPPASNLSDRRRLESKEHGQLVDPLVEERSSVHEHESSYPLAAR
jgi:hypothetical protein